MSEHDDQIRDIDAQLDSLKSEFKTQVIKLAAETIRKMRPLELKGQAIDDLFSFDLQSEYIESVIDEYFQRGFNREDVLRETQANE